MITKQSMSFNLKNYLIFIPFFLVLTSACATKYKPMKSNEGFGYADEKINDLVYKITFQGNSRTSDEKIYHYFMKRSAEVALQHHFQYFTIIESEDLTKYTTVVSPGSPATKARVSILSHSGEPFFTPTEYKTIPKHVLVGTIQLFKEGEQPLNAYSVENILKNEKL